MNQWPTAAEVYAEALYHSEQGSDSVANRLSQFATLLKAMEGQGTPMINKIADDFYNNKIDWLEAVEQARQVERLLVAVREQTRIETIDAVSQILRYECVGDVTLQNPDGKATAYTVGVEEKISALKEKKHD